jgi:hypothetical protein
MKRSPTLTLTLSRASKLMAVCPASGPNLSFNIEKICRNFTDQFPSALPNDTHRAARQCRRRQLLPTSTILVAIPSENSSQLMKASGPSPGGLSSRNCPGFGHSSAGSDMFPELLQEKQVLTGEVVHACAPGNLIGAQSWPSPMCNSRHPHFQCHREL